MVLNDFKNNIIKVINESSLTIDAIYYVMKDIMGDIIEQYNLTLQQEAAAAQSNEPTESENSKAETVAKTKEKEE